MTDERLAELFAKTQEIEVACRQAMNQNSVERETAMLVVRHVTAARRVFESWMTARLVLRAGCRANTESA